MNAQMTLSPVVTFDVVQLATANHLLTDWGHYLGPFARPFGVEAHALTVHDEIVSITVSGSPVSSTVAGHPRSEVVELARLCTRPGEEWATRVALRLWREVAAPAWRYSPARFASAYSQNDRHDGRIYRFDGWSLIREDAGNPPGRSSTWAKGSGPGDAARGRKRLWLHEIRPAA